MITLQRDTIHPALVRLMRMIDPKSSIEIMKRVLFSSTERGTCLTADGPMGCLSISIGKSFDPVPSIALPAKRLLDAVESMPKGSSFDLNTDGTIKLGRRKFSLDLLDASEFMLTKPIDAAIVELPVAPVQRILKSTAYAMEATGQRVNMAGVYLTSPDGAIVGMATDGQRAAVYTCQDFRVAMFPVLIPKHISQEILGYPENERISLRVTDTKAQIDCGTSRVIWPLTVDPYPDLMRVVPVAFASETKVTRLVALESLKAMSEFAKEHSHVTMDCDGTEISIKLMTKEGKELASDSVDCDCDGGTTKTACSPKFLHEAFLGASSEQVMIKFLGELDPLVIQDGQYTAVIMPMRR